MVLPADCALVSVESRYDGSTRSCFNVFGVENPDDHTAQYVAENVRIDWSESISLMQSENVSIIGVHVVRFDDLEFTDPTIVSGEIAIENDPPNTCFLVRKHSGSAGRNNRGRMYIPGVPASWTESNGILVGANVEDANAAVEAFWGKLVADSIPMVLLHRDLPTLATSVTSLTVDSLVASQRRRLR